MIAAGRNPVEPKDRMGYRSLQRTKCDMIENLSPVRSASEFLEKPRLEWRGHRPFAIARLPLDYARTLELLALREEERIMKLPVSRGWEKRADENTAGSRYHSYNALQADTCTISLFLALRSTYRFLLKELKAENRPRCLQAWFNVHRPGQKILRHAHVAQFIAYFAAHAEGSTTQFGPSPASTENDIFLPNVDGGLVVTVGMNHFHETSVWHDAERPRVSYGFNIADQSAHDASYDARGEPIAMIPFDGPDFAV